MGKALPSFILGLLLLLASQCTLIIFISCLLIILAGASSVFGEHPSDAYMNGKLDHLDQAKANRLTPEQIGGCFVKALERNDTMTKDVLAGAEPQKAIVEGLKFAAAHPDVPEEIQHELLNMLPEGYSIIKTPLPSFVIDDHPLANAFRTGNSKFILNFMNSKMASADKEAYANQVTSKTFTISLDTKLQYLLLLKEALNKLRFTTRTVWSAFIFALAEDNITGDNQNPFSDLISKDQRERFYRLRKDIAGNEPFRVESNENPLLLSVILGQSNGKQVPTFLDFYSASKSNYPLAVSALIYVAAYYENVEVLKRVFRWISEKRENCLSIFVDAVTAVISNAKRPKLKTIKSVVLSELNLPPSEMKLASVYMNSTLKAMGHQGGPASAGKVFDDSLGQLAVILNLKKAPPVQAASLDLVDKTKTTGTESMVDNSGQPPTNIKLTNQPLNLVSQPQPPIHVSSSSASSIQSGKDEELMLNVQRHREGLKNKWGSLGAGENIVQDPPLGLPQAQRTESGPGSPPPSSDAAATKRTEPVQPGNPIVGSAPQTPQKSSAIQSTQASLNKGQPRVNQTTTPQGKIEPPSVPPLQPPNPTTSNGSSQRQTVTPNLANESKKSYLDAAKTNLGSSKEQPKDKQAPKLFKGTKTVIMRSKDHTKTASQGKTGIKRPIPDHPRKTTKDQKPEQTRQETVNLGSEDGNKIRNRGNSQISPNNPQHPNPAQVTPTSQATTDSRKHEQAEPSSTSDTLPIPTKKKMKKKARKRSRQINQKKRVDSDFSSGSDYEDVQPARQLGPELPLQHFNTEVPLPELQEPILVKSNSKIASDSQVGSRDIYLNGALAGMVLALIVVLGAIIYFRSSIFAAP